MLQLLEAELEACGRVGSCPSLPGSGSEVATRMGDRKGHRDIEKGKRHQGERQPESGRDPEGGSG